MDERFDELKQLVILVLEKLDFVAMPRTHLNTRQAAVRLGLSRFTVAELCRNRHIEAEKKPNGRRGPHAEWSIPVEAILKFEKEGKLHQEGAK